METSSLEGIGLSKNEIKVFLIMLKLGENKAGAIISKSSLQSSAVYNAINSLIDKGLVSYIKQGQIKYYKAVSPDTIADYLDTKKQEYLKILPELKTLMHGEIEGVEFYKSIRGIKTLVSELMKDAKKEDVYRFFSNEDPHEYKLATEKVYQPQKHIRNKLGIISKGIYSEKLRHLTKRKSVTYKRYLSTPLPPNSEIINGKVGIISWKGEQPSGILIRSKSICDTYVEFFEHMWKIAKK